MKKVPEKFKGCGIRIQCLKCRCEVTCTCFQTGSAIQYCANKDSHKYKLVVHIPGSQSKKATKVLETDSFDEALIEQSKFKRQIREGVNVPTTTPQIVEALVPSVQQGLTPAILVPRFAELSEVKMVPTVERPQVEITKIKYVLVDYISEYLDFIYGINVPTHLKRELTHDHRKEIERTVYRFCDALTEKKYLVKTLCLSHIGQEEIGIFCDHILNKVGSKSYNKACALMKSFYNWCIDIKDCDLKNPFEKMTLRIAAKKDKVAITQEEFKKLLEVITPENGIAILTNGKKINLYHPWLHVAFRLALETGSRAEEVVTLKFNNIVELMKDVLAFKIINLKVWRIETGGDQAQIDKYVKYIPITASLLKLLQDCEYEKHLGTDKFIIPYPVNLKLSFVQDLISRAFTHFIKKVSNRKIEYKDLRKTYITHITMALGDKAEMFTGHSDKGVIQRNYLADSFIAGGLHKLKIYDDCA